MFKNTDKFREVAIEYTETGRFCQYPVNFHRNSQYMKFWREQKKRSLQGYTVDGITITGYHYFYLNFSPIYIVKYDQNSVSSEHGKIVGERVLDFPKFWDSDYDYYWYVEEANQRGEHGTVLKCRGRGYSFKAASMLNRNYFLIPGSRNYAVAYEKEYLTKEGLLSKTWEMMDFINEQTAWGKKRQFKNSDMHRRASYEANIGGVKVEKGYKSEIIGISLKDNPQKIRGKRGKLILFEEAGMFPGMLTAWQIARSSMEQGNVTFGQMLSFGTGGTKNADFMALEELFYSPEGYNVHATPNIWDKGRENTKSGFFIPVTSNYEGYYDKDGNSDIASALAKEEVNRTKVREHSTNISVVTQYIAENCVTPSEAVLRTTGTIFPINDLKERLYDLETNQRIGDADYIGRLSINSSNGKVEWKPDPELKPIYDFPIKNNKNLDGAIVIYEHPYIDESIGTVPYGMYIAGSDVYDHDESTTDSLGSTFVLNLLTNRIVAEYTGRPATANQYYENVRRLLIYYNALCNYENALKGMFTYFDIMHCTHYLADTPKSLVDQELMTEKMFNRKKGTPASEMVNKYGREQLKTWLLEPIPGEELIMNLHRLRSIPLIKELIYWNKDINCDRVSAMGMLMILKQDVFKYLEDRKKPIKLKTSDPLWDRAYQAEGHKNIEGPDLGYDLLTW